MRVPAERLVLHNLPLAARLVLAFFLLSVALGYGSALVQLHFQSARPGTLLPGAKEIERTYFGQREKPVSQMERLLESSQGLMNGAGTMRPAFTDQSRDWEILVRGKTPEELRQLLAEREGERLALLSWVRAGADPTVYDRDDYPLGEKFTHREITATFLVPDAPTGRPVLPKRLRIRSLIAARCVDCHGEAGRVDLATLFPLDSYERLKPYCRIEPSHTMPLGRLAQTTHVHLLGFALLYGATGLLFTLTRYPAPVRLVFGPWTLVAQVVDIGCWWLGRLDPLFAQAILVTGPFVALGLAIQVGGTLWDLFGRPGRTVLLSLLLAAAAAGVLAKFHLIDPYLQQESPTFHTSTVAPLAQGT